MSYHVLLRQRDVTPECGFLFGLLREIIIMNLMKSDWDGRRDGGYFEGQAPL